MEKMLKAYDRENMKLAILKHEKTFKQQVYELHRLYRVQKILMKGVENNKSKRRNQQRLICGSGSNLNHKKGNPHDQFHHKPQLGFRLDQPVEKYIKETNGHSELEIADESEIQLTLGPTSCNKRKKSETSDSGTSFSSSSTGSSNIINGTNHQNQKNSAWSLTMVSADSNSRYNVKKNGSCAEDQSSHGKLSQPPWLLQALSLNMSKT